MFGKQAVICTVVLLVAALCVGCDDGADGGAALIPPTITTHPSDQTVTEGGATTFTVAATGSGVLTYQWYRNTVEILGATWRSCTTPATVFADDGAQFMCLVTNAVGSVESNAATLTVNILSPRITGHPADMAVTEGQTTVFSVTATGSGTLTYQWKKDGTDIGGATSASYITPAVVLADDGALFTCVVTNEGGDVTSTAATLIVIPPPPVITSFPVNQTVTEGETATFSVTATGSGTLTYRWEEDGADVAGGTGGTTASYTTLATEFADNGAEFTCVVTNDGGSVTSNAATLTVNPAPPKTYMIVDLETGDITDADSVLDLLANADYKTIKLVLKRIPAGTFQMGDQTGVGSSWELPVHTVNITQPFYMGVFEVTQKQWQMIEGDWPSYHKLAPDKRPVEMVSWDDINGSGGFMDTISSLASMSFRLPTEAEWEYSCKAETSTNYSYGDTEISAWMWYKPNSPDGPKEVATTPGKPNPWGLYDMHGNVYEWCWDWHDDTYYSVSPSDDPQGPSNGSFRALRGGSWDHIGNFCRAAARARGAPDGVNDCIGFRVVATGP